MYPTYDAARQNEDRAFLVGCSHGRDSERAWWVAAVADASSLDHLFNLMESRNE